MTRDWTKGCCQLKNTVSPYEYSFKQSSLIHTDSILNVLLLCSLASLGDQFVCNTVITYPYCSSYLSSIIELLFELLQEFNLAVLSLCNFLSM